VNRSAGLLIGVCVLLAAAGVASGVPAIDGSGGYAGLSPRFLPTLVAVGLAVCGLGLVISSRRAIPAAPTPAFSGASAVVWLLGGLILHLVLIGWIGFVAASVLLMTCAARGHGSRRPLRDALVALTLALPVWWLFSRGLGLGLPLFPLFGS
jgi:putative tricarboxylic transport membrane protein